MSAGPSESQTPAAATVDGSGNVNGGSALKSLPIEAPEGRRLQVYAFDPSLSTRMDTSLINRATLTVPWEDDVRPGPVGEYIEVVDVDPGSECVYLPVDLNHPYLLARDGLYPSEGNPQFHQQMVYAVAMNTLRNFEQALGRPALWSPREAAQQPDGSWTEDEYVRRLRIYPHALREANAYYSPEKKALLMGYFPADASDPAGHFPGGMVFACLSQDILAHETAHALLDGMHRRFVEPSNEDGLALHEGFADIVAIFQRFAMTDVLRDQIARTRGDLATHQHLLGQIAHEFGRAVGLKGALRNALGRGEVDSTGRWKPAQPDPGELAVTTEPHARGGILVAAVFDAFLAIYRSRIEGLIRIATDGTGVLPEGEISADLVSRIADAASKSAKHVLNMCIRAMDYLPPVDVTFGDYLRGLITADYDLVPNDARQYRLAFLTGFRARGIYPRDIRSLSVDTLRWRSPRDTGESADALEFGRKLSEQLQGFANEWRLTGRTYESQSAAQAFILAMGTVAGSSGSSADEGPNLSGTYREAVFLKSRRMRRNLQKWVQDVPDDAKNSLLGLDLTPGPDGPASFEVHAVRPVRRVGPDDRILQQMIIEITQKRPEWFRPPDPSKPAPTAKPDFYFRGGATLIVDLETGAIRYIIRRPINDPARLKRQREFLSGQGVITDGDAGDHATQLRQLYLGRTGECREPFAVLHRSAPRDGDGEEDA